MADLIWRLRCAYARAALAQRPALVALTREQKLTLAGNYFSEPWVIQYAIDLMHDYEQMVGITAPKALVALTDEQMREGLRLHGLEPVKPSQLADGFRAGVRWVERTHGITAPKAQERE